MPNLTPGDLVTFPLRGGTYGVALVVHVDDLSLNDLYHLAICDAVVEGADGGEDEFGSPIPRRHDVAAVEAAPVLIEHVGLTRDGLEASDFAVVSEREVGEAELQGYHAWLHLRYQDAVRRGVMRERIDDNPDAEEEELDDELEGDELDDELDGEAPSEAGDREAVESEESESAEDDREEVDREDVEREDAGPDGADRGEAEVAAATLGVHDVALGIALIRQRAIFERDAYRDSALGRYFMQLGEDDGTVAAIIARLLDGDFAAGDELIDYGEAGMRMLGEQLRDDMAPELADDLLQVLVNSGETVAYELVGTFMERHGGDRGDPLYGSAVRAFCYAVMLTAGEPEPLKERLGMLESIREPELLDDVRAAREALAGEG